MMLGQTDPISGLSLEDFGDIDFGDFSLRDDMGGQSELRDDQIRPVLIESMSANGSIFGPGEVAQARQRIRDISGNKDLRDMLAELNQIQRIAEESGLGTAKDHSDINNLRTALVAKIQGKSSGFGFLPTNMTTRQKQMAGAVTALVGLSLLFLLMRR